MSEERTITIDDLNNILKQNPDLSSEGTNTFSYYRSMHRQASKQELINLCSKARDRLRGDRYLKSFLYCCKWLSKVEKTCKNVNSKPGSSYTYKHVVEHNCKEYVPNGAFIAAALCMNFYTKCDYYDSPNCLVNISSLDRFRKSQFLARKLGNVEPFFTEEDKEHIEAGFVTV
jgi:hypothetical protein